MTFPVEPNDIGFYFLIISQGTLDAPDGIHPHVHIRTAYLPQIDLLKLETDPAQMASRRRGKPRNVMIISVIVFRVMFVLQGL